MEEGGGGKNKPEITGRRLVSFVTFKNIFGRSITYEKKNPIKYTP